MRTALVMLLVLCMPAAAHAADFSSMNFLARNPLVDAFGGFGSSTSFFSFLAGGQTVTGEASSTNFAVAAGFLYFDSFAPESRHWRWYDDEASETPTVPFVAEDVAPVDISTGDTLKLRVTVRETVDIGQEGTKFRLQYSTSSDFSTGAVSLVEQGSCTGSSVWCYADGGGSDNGVVTTALISDADSCSGGVGVGCGTHNESGTSVSSFTHDKSATTEYEFTIQQTGATTNTVYFFRLFDTTASSSVPLASGLSYPSVLTGGTTLAVSIDGVLSATTLEGVTTDVDTSPTSISFGNLPQGVPVTGAQQFTVSTNAGLGYRIFAFERQALLDGSGGQIDPIAGTNASPTGWSSGCVVDTSCYGYHAGDDVLQGGSTRFAADDTYAQFDGSAREVAYSAGPASSRVTNMVYRLENVGQEAAGDYSSSVVYIVVPVF